MSITLDDVTHFAQYFKVLSHDPSATRFVQVQSGSFCWSDEKPTFVQDGYPASITQFFIALLSYRTASMRGEAIPAFDPYWNRLRELCPNWPGFIPSRMDPSLIPQLDHEFDVELERWERVFRICQRRRELEQTPD